MTSQDRIGAIDLLRGLVIAAMALDHTRDFFQPIGASPEDLATTTLPFFLTRWITHYCAPVFVFLAGVAVALYTRRRPPADALRFLVTRGVWLMLLEATWVSFSWHFGFPLTHLGVLWAIGGAMVVLAAVARRPRLVVGAIGLAITVLLHTFEVPATLPVLGMLCQPQGFDILGHHFAQSYAIVPWFAVMACGFGIAGLLADPQRRLRLVWIGAAALVAFVALRALNGYGDPRPWVAHARGGWVTAAAFANPSKYPPSLMFQLMTLGPALAVLPLLALWRGRIAGVFLTFGQVPLFFYLLHLPVIHLAGLVHAEIRFGQSRIPEGEPLSLALIYTAWVALLGTTWPVCRAWQRLKRSRRDWWWLSYL